MLVGRLEMAEWLTENTKGEEIIVSRKLSEPHIYLAFAAKWNPKDYQENSLSWDYKEKNVNLVDQIPEYGLGKYIFKNIDWEKDSLEDTLLVGKPEEFPDQVLPLKTFYYPDGEAAVVVVDPANELYAEKIN